jgi:hypothetical protein
MRTGQFRSLPRIVWKDLYFEKDWREYKYGTGFTDISEDAKQKLTRLLTAYSSEEGLESYGISSH